MRPWKIFLLSYLFLTALVVYNVWISYKQSGLLVYPLDDTYIHMAIAKNIKEHGVWGATRFAFSSTSSSVLYTLILWFAFVVTGINIWIPLIINWLVAGILLYLLSRISLQFMVGKASLLIHFVMILTVPLSGMVVLGMEHTLHILLCTMFIWLTYKKWKGLAVNNYWYALLVSLAVLARYESSFLIGIVALVWLVFYRKPGVFVLLMVSVLTPICFFGLYSIQQGGFFFPNSLLAKSTHLGGSLGVFAVTLTQKFLSTSLLAAIIFIPLSYWLIFPPKNISDITSKPSYPITLCVALCAIAHLSLANFGWLFRYEAYLVALLFLSVMITWPDWKLYLLEKGIFWRIPAVLLSAVMLFPIWSRILILFYTNMA
ncbi:MAG: hypothetical protein H7Y03_14255, partial [Chitinophagaceae bacterium]|nr:hypothetical protein [Chitinophagaceae bacterium]